MRARAVVDRAASPVGPDRNSSGKLHRRRGTGDVLVGVQKLAVSSGPLGEAHRVRIAAVLVRLEIHQ